MQIESELNALFSYSLLPAFIVLIIIIVIFLYLFNGKGKKKDIVKTVIIPCKSDLISIKNKYLINMDLVLRDFNNKVITERVAFQRLSSLIRNFIHETTNIKVQNYTLKEIKLVNMPVLYELVSEYYDPEFAVASDGNFIKSYNKTRMVIERWR